MAGCSTSSRILQPPRWHIYLDGDSTALLTRLTRMCQPATMAPSDPRRPSSHRASCTPQPLYLTREPAHLLGPRRPSKARALERTRTLSLPMSACELSRQPYMRSFGTLIPFAPPQMCRPFKSWHRVFCPQRVCLSSTCKDLESTRPSNTSQPTV